LSELTERVHVIGHRLLHLWLTGGIIS
jgi:hypothetical protein